MSAAEIYRDYLETIAWRSRQCRVSARHSMFSPVWTRIYREAGIYYRPRAGALALWSEWERPKQGSAWLRQRRREVNNQKARLSKRYLQSQRLRERFASAFTESQ
jgi:hypothetical protein